VRFTKSVTLNEMIAGQEPFTTVYEAGKVYEVSEGRAQHFEKRDACVRVTDEPVKAKAETASIAPPENAAIPEPAKRGPGRPKKGD